MDSTRYYVTDGRIDVVGKGKKVYLFIKRAFDIILSVGALIVLIIPLLILWVAVRLDSKGPAIYVHERIGKDGKPFKMYKFRSMYIDSRERLEEILKDPERKREWEENYKLDDDPRITRVGRFIRKTSLDELPQLINIIKGDMSIVGPRPVLREELETYYTPEQQKALLSVKPGLTGYWQAYARNDAKYGKISGGGARQQMELYYIENMSSLLDVRIIFRTVKAVLLCSGAK